MKKLLICNLPLIGVFLLSCSSGNKESFKADSKVIFTEFLVGNRLDDRAVEITNFSDKEIDLSAYSIRIFPSYDKEAKYTIALEGTLSPNGSYVVCYSASSEEIKAKANLITSDLMNIGGYPMGLFNKDRLLDCIGHISYPLSLFSQMTMIRKNERRKPKEISNENDWLLYSKGYIDNLGNGICPISEEEALDGPRLSEEALSLPFFDPNNSDRGAGGAVEVSIAYLGDGDTTNFNYPEEFHSNGIRDGHSIRYYGIDTPEVQHGTSINAEPWGEAAASFNNSELRSAEHIRIQSIKGGGVKENYGRLLGYVWYTDKTNPEPEDYSLLNHIMLLNGLAKTYYESEMSNTMAYKDVPYSSYMKNAENHAKELKIKIHGEVDPNFSYDI